MIRFALRCCWIIYVDSDNLSNVNFHPTHLRKSFCLPKQQRAMKKAVNGSWKNQGSFPGLGPAAIVLDLQKNSISAWLIVCQYLEPNHLYQWCWNIQPLPVRITSKPLFEKSSRPILSNHAHASSIFVLLRLWWMKNSTNWDATTRVKYKSQELTSLQCLNVWSNLIQR